MNDTNRALNRFVVLIGGLLLLALGASAIALVTWPAAAKHGTRALESVQAWLVNATATSTIAGTEASWVMIGALAVVLLVSVLTIVILTRLGGGGTRSVLRSTSDDSPLGLVVIDVAFMSDALRHALAKHPDVLSSSVTARTVAHERVLHVVVSSRQNASPRAILDDIERLLANLEILTGRDLATCVAIRSGMRTTFAADRRRVT